MEKKRVPDFEMAALTEQIIGAAIEVHRQLGPGLLESTYEQCPMFELAQRALHAERQVAIPVVYKGIKIDCGYKIDVLIEGKVVVEPKVVDRMDPIYEAQLLTYLKLGQFPVGLMINFNVRLLRNGIYRRALARSPLGALGDLSGESSPGEPAMNIPIRKHMLIRHQNHLFFVEDLSEHHSGKMKPTVHVRLRDVKDGRHVDRNLDDLDPWQEVDHATRPVQFSYTRGQTHVFLDSETFEEVEIDETQISGFQPFLREGQEFRVMLAEGRPVHIQTPDIVVLKVATTAAPGHAVGATGNVMKDATLENGLTIKVPMFIRQGEAVRVDTRTRAYAGKEKET